VPDIAGHYLLQLVVVYNREDQIYINTEIRKMTRQLISSGSIFEEDIGYSRAVPMTISPNVEEQAEQCLKNIVLALESADSSLRDVVRVTYVLPDADDFPKCWPILKKYFGSIRPAAMMISARLADSTMKIEIEATALKQ